MIKINLAAKRKQRQDVGKNSRAGSKGIQSDSLKELPLRKAGLPMLVCIFATYMAESYKDEELQKVNIALQKMTAQGVESKKQVSKMADLEMLQRNLDAQGQAIQGKMDAIRKVVGSRPNSSKLLSSLASAVPTDVWLSDIRMENGILTLKGGAIGMNKVSDFMKNLKGNAFLSGVELKNTQQERERGTEVASFELRGTRRTPE